MIDEHARKDDDTDPHPSEPCSGSIFSWPFFLESWIDGIPGDVHQLGEDIEKNDEKRHVVVKREDEVAHPGGNDEKEETGENGDFFVSAESAGKRVHEKDAERDDQSGEEFHRPVYGVVRLAEHPHDNLIALGVWFTVLQRVIRRGKCLRFSDVVGDSRVPPRIGIFKIVVLEGASYVHFHGDREECEHEERIPECFALPALRQCRKELPRFERGEWLVFDYGTD